MTFLVFFYQTCITNNLKTLWIPSILSVVSVKIHLSSNCHLPIQFLLVLPLICQVEMSVKCDINILYMYTVLQCNTLDSSTLVQFLTCFLHVVKCICSSCWWIYNLSCTCTPLLILHMLPWRWVRSRKLRLWKLCWWYLRM